MEIMSSLLPILSTPSPVSLQHHPPAPPPLSGSLPGVGFLAPRSQRHQQVWVLVSVSLVLEAAVTLLPDPWVTSLLGHLPDAHP